MLLFSFVSKSLGLHFKMQFVWHMIFFIDATTHAYRMASLSLALSLSPSTDLSLSSPWLAHKSRQFIYDTIYSNQGQEEEQQLRHT